ncbi:MAG: NUDIX domain-containing protein, partial [Myxococcales bacterium]|nr:NUDIX domain-containing protein [Myxococcales bacterium]
MAKQVVAVAVVVVEAQKLLALRRSKKKDVGAGLWEVVSGRVRDGEDPLAAAIRETREETGLEVQIVERPVDCYAAKRGDDPMT